MSSNDKEYYVDQKIAPGTVLSNQKELPPLFTKIKIKDMELSNRIVVSPMCMYSSNDGFSTDFHLVHLGQFAMRGAGLVIMEATAISNIGRISPNCLGIYKDEHITNLKRIADYFHLHKAKVGIQLAHAGRKASTFPIFHEKLGQKALPEEGGWKTIFAPSTIPYDDNSIIPKEMSLNDIEEVKNQFKDAAERAYKAGIDVIEIHSAHGYLLHSFLSPISNKRKDNYGGSFENRIRMLIEVIESVKTVWPQEKPLFVRISCTDFVEGESWTIEQSVELAKILKKLGVDLVDCSSSALSPAQKIPIKPLFQVPFAHEIKKAVPDLLTGAVGLITNSKDANDIIKENKADLVFMARKFLADGSFVQSAAQELGVDIKWIYQYERGKRL